MALKMIKLWPKMDLNRQIFYGLQRASARRGGASGGACGGPQNPVYTSSLTPGLSWSHGAPAPSAGFLLSL